PIWSENSAKRHASSVSFTENAYVAPSVVRLASNPAGGRPTSGNPERPTYAPADEVTRLSAVLICRATPVAPVRRARWSGVSSAPCKHGCAWLEAVVGRPATTSPAAITTAVRNPNPTSPFIRNLLVSRTETFILRPSPHATKRIR